MKSSVALLFFVGFACCAVTFADESNPGIPHGGGSYGILTPNGSYKPGSIYEWCVILRHLKEYTKPSGYGALQEWMNAQPKYNKALTEGNIPALHNLFQGAVPVLRELEPHLEGQTLRATLDKIADECQQLATKLASGHGSLQDIETFLLLVSRQINSAMGQ